MFTRLEEIATHEAGHAIAFTLLGIPIESIRAESNGGSVYLSQPYSMGEARSERARKFALGVIGGAIAETIRENLPYAMPPSLIAALAVGRMKADSHKYGGDTDHLKQCRVASVADGELSAWLEKGGCESDLWEWAETLGEECVVMLRAEWPAVAKLAHEIHQSGQTHGVRPATLIVENREERAKATALLYRSTPVRAVAVGPSRELIRVSVSNCTINGKPWKGTVAR